MHRAVLAIAAAFSFTACESSPPCTQCPNVAGVYEVTLAALDAEKSSCKQIQFGGGTVQVSLKQEASALAFDDALPLEGTLLENNTATVQTRKPITSDAGLSINASSLLTFAGTEGAMTISGNLSLTVLEPSCQLTVPLQAKQVAVAPQ